MHKVGLSPKTEFPSGTPLSAAGETTCYTCHLFHSSDLPKLWRGDDREQCGYGCHSDPAEEEEE